MDFALAASTGKGSAWEPEKQRSAQDLATEECRFGLDPPETVSCAQVVFQVLQQATQRLGVSYPMEMQEQEVGT
jgi:hypothetical protein